ncbi:hypothetical protein POF53_18700 [Mitsuaria sp. RG]|nr:hypothetical protein [Mitsuaria sp. RG]
MRSTVTINRKAGLLVGMEGVSSGARLLAQWWRPPALTPGLGKHSIMAATLNVTYWPDRNSPEAYAHLEIQAINE